MKRATILVVLSLLAASSVHAQQWETVAMRGLPFEFSLPPDFVPTGKAPDGEVVFDGPNGSRLTVGGGRHADGFEQTVRQSMRADEAAGWDITYERFSRRWASYSGIRDGQIRYVRAIEVCDDRLALFVLDYRRSEKRAYDPVVTRMVRSLKTTC